MQNANFILELSNGCNSIITAFLLLFLTSYLFTGISRKGLRWRLLFMVPTALALGIAMYVEKVGTLVTRSGIWVWRLTTQGELPFTSVQTAFLILGSLITTVGLLMLLRILSRPRYGDWPWSIALSTVLIYVVGTIIARV